MTPSDKDRALAEELAVDIHDIDDIAHALARCRAEERATIVEFGRGHEAMFLDKSTLPGSDPKTVALRLAASGAESALRLLLDNVERGAHAAIADPAEAFSTTGAVPSPKL